MRAPTDQISSAKGALEAQAPCYIWRFDANGHCLDWNQEAACLLKTPEDSLEGLNWMNLFLSKDAKTMKELLKNPHSPHDFQIESRLAESNENIILIKARRLENEGGVFLGYIASGLDISELHHARLKMLKTARELEISNQELEQYAYVVSHDLQEPLRMITGFCELLKEECDSKLDANSQEYIDFICDGAKRMNQLIRSLLSYSQVSRKKIKIQSCNLTTVFSNVKQNLNSKIIETGATFLVPKKLPHVQANEVFVTQIFQNLIENALKYRHPHRSPEVIIDHEIRDDSVVIFVKDNGKGIAPKNHARIFKLFQRGSAAGAEDGLGIGLALAKKLTESLEGKIELESDGQSGSVFKVCLPRNGDQK